MTAQPITETESAGVGGDQHRRLQVLGADLEAISHVDTVRRGPNTTFSSKRSTRDSCRC